MKLVLVYILERGVYLCLFHVPEYPKPLSQKVSVTGEVKDCYLGYMYLVDMHICSINSEACCINLKSVLCVL